MTWKQLSPLLAALALAIGAVIIAAHGPQYVACPRGDFPGIASDPICKVQP